MKIQEIIWLESVEDKIIGKHQVHPFEVEQLLNNRPHIRFMELGHQPAKIYMPLLGKVMADVIWLFTSSPNLINEP
jgi:hypothetical protein